MQNEKLIKALTILNRLETNIEKFEKNLIDLEEKELELKLKKLRDDKNKRFNSIS